MTFTLSGINAAAAFSGNRTRKKEEAAFRRLKIRVAQQANKERLRQSLIRLFQLPDDIPLKDALQSRENAKRRLAEARRNNLPAIKAERKRRAIVTKGLGLPRHASDEAIRAANIQMGYALFSGLDPLARLTEIARRLHLPASSGLERIGRRVEALSAALHTQELPRTVLGGKALARIETNVRAAKLLGLPPSASRREIQEARFDIPAL